MHEYIVNFWLKTVVIFSLLYLMPQQVYEHTFISFLTSSWMSRTVFGGDLLNNVSLEEKQLKKKQEQKMTKRFNISLCLQRATTSYL